VSTSLQISQKNTFFSPSLTFFAACLFLVINNISTGANVIKLFILDDVYLIFSKLNLFSADQKVFCQFKISSQSASF
jgi:hypothetical protein